MVLAEENGFGLFGHSRGCVVDCLRDGVRAPDGSSGRDLNDATRERKPIANYFG